MNPIFQGFLSNLDIVYFVYGLAFVIMGLSILIISKKESEFKIANILWILALFGLTHGVNEWLDMWSIIKGQTLIFDFIRWVILIISFIFLFEFGSQLLRLTGSENPNRRKKIAVSFLHLLTPIISIFVLITGITSFDFMITGNIWARYLLCFPGSSIIGFGFILYYRKQKERLELLKVKKYFLWISLSFIAYGILSGLVVPKGNFFPANWLNFDSFISVVKIPVQVFRAICALIVAWSISGILRIFNWERKRKIQDALKKEKSAKNYVDNIIKSMVATLIVTDSKGKIKTINQATLDLLGYRKEEIIGKHVTLLFAKTEEMFIEKRLSKLINDKKFQNYETAYRTKSGNLVPMLLSGATLKDQEGNLKGIVIVAKDITELKRVEETIKRKLEFEKMISEISSRFIGMYDIDKAINSSLADIGNLSGASRAYLFLFREDGAIMDNTHEWCAKGVQAEIDNLQNLPTDMFPWWMKKLGNKEVIHIKDVSRMPIEAKMEKETLESQGIKSLLVLPLYVKGKSAGFIGFDNVSETEEWREEDFSILRISSEMIGNGLARERAEKALLESKEKYRTVVEKTGDVPYVMDDKAVVSYIGPQVEKYGFRIEDIVDRNFMEIIYTEDKEKTFKDFQKTMQNGIETITTFRVETPKMGIRYFEENGRILRDDEGQIIGLAGIIRDITERKRAEEKLKQRVKEARFLSLIDDLTGLYNRRGFFTLAEQHLKLSRRKKRELLVVYVDVDQLKGINDTLGHRVGSLALIETGNILKETFRESDIIARIGGDEFVVLAIETSGTNLTSIAARFQENLEAHNSRRNRPYKYHLSISLGISRYDPQNPCSIDELVDRADKLMYKEKRRKKTEVRF